MANAPDGWTPPRQDELRSPPHNDEAERSLLGAIFLENRVFDEVLAIVQAEDLYRESHRHIFRAMAALHARGDAIDVITVADYLAAEKLLEAVGGPNFLARLSSEIPSATNVSYYATIISRKASLRNFITTAHALIDECYNDVTDFDAFMDSAESKLFAITQSGAKKGYVSMREVIKEAFAQIEALYQKAEQVTGVPSGFIDLDEITAGWQPSDLIILAARPAMGKCLTADAEVVLADGRVRTIEQIYDEAAGEVWALDESLEFVSAAISDFIDDGQKRVFEVTTRSGRRVSTTASHPFLTVSGWKQLCELEQGCRIAVPRELPCVGERSEEEARIKLAAYLIGDGNLSQSTPRFTQKNSEIVEDFRGAVHQFGALEVSTSYDDSRTPTDRIVRDRATVSRARASFASALGALLEECELSQRQLAEHVGVSPSTVTHWLQEAYAPSMEYIQRIASLCEVDVDELLPVELHNSLRHEDENPLTLWLKEIKLWGCTASDKHVPDFVFQLPRAQLALFLNRLFATDGWACELASGQVQVGYSSISERLIRQVSHLLLRFGVLCQIRQKKAAKLSTMPPWQLDITHASSLRIFATEIGIYTKMEALNGLMEREPSDHHNRDVVPIEIWAQIEELKGDESWASLARRAGIPWTNMHQHRRGVSRARLEKLARALESKALMSLARSHVYWDEIVEIRDVGVRQVYDLTVSGLHNFVANDVCVHNTALTLNMASHAAIERKVPVAFFSLEMANVQLAIRMLCSEARIDQSKLRTGRMTEQEWARLIKAAGTLSESPIFLDDTPALPIMEFRSKARLLKAEHDIGIIFIDYLQLMKATGKSIGSREQEISEISRNLKGIAKELQVPVIALAQLNRGVESRADKRPMNSDLRESGAIEQDADIISFIYRDEVYNPESEHKGLAEVILGKHRNGGLGTVRLRFFGQYTRFENLAPEMAESLAPIPSE